MTKTEAISTLQSAINSCEEAIEGTWDKSDEGFEDMSLCLQRVMDYLTAERDTIYALKECRDALKDIIGAAGNKQPYTYEELVHPDCGFMAAIITAEALIDKIEEGSTK